MVKNKPVLTSGQKIKELKSRLRHGDYVTLAEVIGCKREAAKKRFERGNPVAYSALLRIVDGSDALIEELKNEFNPTQQS